MAKKNTHKVTAEDIAASAQLREEGVKEGDELFIGVVGVDTGRDGEVPTFTIRADSKFGIAAMIAVCVHAIQHVATEEERRELVLKLREFDLYEEAHRS